MSPSVVWFLVRNKYRETLSGHAFACQRLASHATTSKPATPVNKWRFWLIQKNKRISCTTLRIRVLLSFSGQVEQFLCPNFTSKCLSACDLHHATIAVIYATYWIWHFCAANLVVAVTIYNGQHLGSPMDW